MKGDSREQSLYHMKERFILFIMLELAIYQNGDTTSWRCSCGCSCFLPASQFFIFLFNLTRWKRQQWLRSQWQLSTDMVNGKSYLEVAFEVAPFIFFWCGGPRLLFLFKIPHVENCSQDWVVWFYRQKFTYEFSVPEILWWCGCGHWLDYIEFPCKLKCNEPKIYYYGTYTQTSRPTNFSTYFLYPC